MTRAATLTLRFVLLLALTMPALAQEVSSADTDAAVREAVRRQAFTVELRQKLGEAGLAEQRKDVVTASKLFESAYELCQKIGSGIDVETKATIAGIVRTRIQLAQRSQEHEDYPDADVQVRAALRVDGKNQALLEWKRKNDGLLAAQAGRIPSQAVIDQIPSIITNKVKNATLVQDGKLLYELGKWDEAEAKLKQVIASEPENRAAAYYMNLIREARYNAGVRNADVNAQKTLVEIIDAKQPELQRELLPKPNPYARTNLVFTGEGRHNIINKLDRIILSEVKYDGLELGDVIKNLSEAAKKRDPDNLGINFLILADTGSANAPAAGGIDPTTGLPSAAVPAETVDLSTVHIKITSPLNNVRLADVLDAIVKTAEKPIKYSVEDYAVVFSIKPAESPALYNRTFKVDPNTFIQGLQGVTSQSFGAVATGNGGYGGNGGGYGGGGYGGGGYGGGGYGGNGGGGYGGNGGGGYGGNGGNNGGGATVAKINIAGGGGSGGGGGGIKYVTGQTAMSGIMSDVKSFFAAAGVDLSGPGRAVIFNDRSGILFVRATLQELDIIEAEIQTLNVSPPQVTIRAKFVEVDQNDVRALGFNWYLGNTLLGNGNVGLQAGTAPSYNGNPSTANPPGVFPNPLVSQAATDTLLTSGLRNPLNAPTLGTITGILTDPQFRMAVQALEQRDNSDVINAPEVTTLSGRQTHFEVTDMQSVVTGANANQTASVSQNNNGVATSSGAVGSAINFNVSTLPFGPSLDVVPYVCADGFTIQMSIIPTVTEFLGYDTQTASQFVVQAQGTQGTPIQQQLPLPKSRVRQITTTCVVWDGQTVVLGGLITGNTLKTKDKVPVLGDLPWLGRFFRSESNSDSKKNLLIFVTPTIIDPAGNRLHSEEEMPFAQNGIPPQRPVAGQP